MGKLLQKSPSDKNILYINLGEKDESMILEFVLFCIVTDAEKAKGKAVTAAEKLQAVRQAKKYRRMVEELSKPEKAEQAQEQTARQEEPVGKGAFGEIYDGFKGKWKAAIEFLKKKQSGEAVAALHHHTIGDISLVWGDKKMGLSKILTKHPEVVDNLQDIIDGMEIVSESENRIKLESPTHFAVVSKEYLGEPREKWLLTAFEKKGASGGSIDIVPEPQKGKQNGTATLQDTFTEGKVNGNDGNVQGKNDGRRFAEQPELNGNHEGMTAVRLADGSHKWVGLQRGEATEGMTDEEIALLDGMAKKLGLPIVARRFGDSRINGVFSGGVVYINPDRDKKWTVRWVAGHELLHDVEKLSPEMYDEYRKAVKGLMGKREYEEKVAEIMQDYGDAGHPVDRAQAEKEVVNDYGGTLFSSRDGMKIMQGILDKAGREGKPEFVKRLMEWWDRIKEFFKGSPYYADVRNAMEKAYTDAMKNAREGMNAEEAKTEHTNDRQGNPINADGTLKLESVNSVDDITDEDFSKPTRNVQLPKLPKKIDNAIGAGGKPVVIKRNIFEKNRNSHKDLSPKQGREILTNALYNPDLYGQNQKTSRPYNWILIHNADKHSSVILEVNHNKDNTEIVNWHYLDDRALKQKERQAVKEGGLILTLGSAVGNTHNDLSDVKDTEKGSHEQRYSVKNQAEKATEKEVNNAVTSLMEQFNSGLENKNTYELGEMFRSLCRLNAMTYKGYGRKNADQATINAKVYGTKERLLKPLADALYQKGADISTDRGVVYFRNDDGVQMSLHTRMFDYSFNDSPYKKPVSWDGIFNSWRYTDKNDYEAAKAIRKKADEVVANAKIETIEILRSLYKDAFKNSNRVKSMFGTSKADLYDAIDKAEDYELIGGFFIVHGKHPDYYKRERIKYLVRNEAEKRGYHANLNYIYESLINEKLTENNLPFKYFDEELLPKDLGKSGDQAEYSVKKKDDEDYADFAKRHGLDDEDVALYAEGIRKGSTSQAFRALGIIGNKITTRHEGEIHSLRDVRKLRRPVEKALKETYGDVDTLLDEYRQRVMDERNAMEAARRKAEEEEAERRKHQDELSMLSDEEMESRYTQALENGDETTAREMVNEAARRNGYGDAGSDYQGVGAWSAPTNPGYATDAERRADEDNSTFNVEDMALGYSSQPSDYFSNPRAYGYDNPAGRESSRAITEAMDALKHGKKDVKVKVYRAVPTSVKEGKLRRGDWVTPSKAYAEMHGNGRLEGKYRIIEDEVPVNELWWDGNDVNEWGYDNGRDFAYRNTKNNRKLLDTVTYDDNGEVIPLSKRFNPRKADERYSIKPTSHRSKEAEKRDKMMRNVDRVTAFVTGKTEKEAREERKRKERNFREETKELYDRVLSGNFDDVTLQKLNDFINKVTPLNYYGRPLSKRLPQRVGQKVHGGTQANSVDALFSRISESAVRPNERTRQEARRRIAEKKKELLKGWAIATGNWHTDLSDFTDDKTPIGSGKDSDVYTARDGSHVIKVSKGKDSLKKFAPDIDAVALFNYVFPNSKYDILGYGEIGGKFVKFLQQPIVDFSDSTPLSAEERVAYMGKLGFKPINRERTAFSNGQIAVADLQKGNIVKDKAGNISVIDADVKLHTKDFGGDYTYPPVERDTEQYSIVGERGAENLDKAEERTLRMDNLAVAREMENAKKDAKTIRLATGWERGADGKWRYEIGDVALPNSLRLIDRRKETVTTLDEILDDNSEKDSLLKSYPQLKDMPLVFRDMGYNTAGEYDYSNKAIVLNSYLLTDDSGAITEAADSILSHEIQHAIQDIEGFARGGSEKMFQYSEPTETERQYATFDELVRDNFGNNYAKTIIAIINGNAPEYQKFRNGFGKSWDEFFKNLKGMLGMMNGDEKLFKENYDYYVGEGKKKSAFEQYQSLGGEVEARNVQKRMDMTDTERKKTPLADTEDVAREDQIFLFGSGDTSEMGSRVNKRMQEIGKRLKNTEMDGDEHAVANVYSGATNNASIKFSNDGKQHTVVMRQGREDKGGTKHSILRHYQTGVGTITDKDILLIPKILKEGECRELDKKNLKAFEYVKEIDGSKYTVYTEMQDGREVFCDFYSNKKGDNTRLLNTQLSAQATDITANPDAKVIETFDPAKASGEKNSPYEEFSTDNARDTGGAEYSIVSDKKKIRELESGELVPMYRTFQVIDGKLYPPMATVQDGKRTHPIEVGDWWQSDERPDLAEVKTTGKNAKVFRADDGRISRKDGKWVITVDGRDMALSSKDGELNHYFNLKKGGKGDPVSDDLDAAYNPYIHASKSALNDQFKGAYLRPNLVLAEVLVPKSETEGRYKAKYAKDATGETPWNSGAVMNQMSRLGAPGRTVTLSRYGKVSRVYDAKEWADRIDADTADYKDSITLPFVSFPTEVLTELWKKGYRVTPPESEKAMPYYRRWLAETGQTGKRADESLIDYAKRKAEEYSIKRAFGGNSGYVGYSKSKRAVDAEKRGLRSMSQMDREFAERVREIVSEESGKEAKMTLAEIKRVAKGMRGDEWHHTSMYGNRTNYYSAESIADEFLGRDEYKSEEQKAAEREAEERKRKADEQRAAREERLRDALITDRDVKTNVEDRDYKHEYTNDVFTSSNGYQIVVGKGMPEERATVYNSQFLNNGKESKRELYLTEWYRDDHYDELKKAVDEYNARLDDAIAKETQFSIKAEKKGNEFVVKKGDEAIEEMDSIFKKPVKIALPEKITTLEQFRELFKKPIRSFLGELIKVKDEVFNKINREKRANISGGVLPTIENADFAIRDTDGSTLYVKRYNSENSGNVYNIVVVNKHGEVEDYISSVHIKRNGNLLNKIKQGAELLLPQSRNTDGILSRNNSTPDANVGNNPDNASESGEEFSIKGGKNLDERLNSKYVKTRYNAAREMCRGNDEALDILADTTPHTLEELIAESLSGAKGQKLLWEDNGVKRGLKAHLGYGNEERRMMSGFLSPNGISPEHFAERLVESADHLGIEHGDTMDMLDAVLNTVASRSKRELGDLLLNNRIDRALDVVRKQKEWDAEQEQMYLDTLLPAERDEYLAQKAEQEAVKWMSDRQREKYLADKRRERMLAEMTDAEREEVLAKQRWYEDNKYTMEDAFRRERGEERQTAKSKLQEKYDTVRKSFYKLLKQQSERATNILVELERAC